jgi:hypothetical protein
MKKKLYFKWIRFTKKFSKRYIPTKDEEKVLDIIKTLLKNPKVKYYFDPHTLERYLVYKEGEINIIISSVDGIIIGNHQYEYRVFVKSPIYEEITKSFDRFLHNKVVKVEKEIKQNRISSLDKISLTLK